MKELKQDDMILLEGATVLDGKQDEAVDDTEVLDDLPPEEDDLGPAEDEEVDTPSPEPTVAADALETAPAARNEPSEDDKVRAAYELLVSKGIVAPPQQQAAAQTEDDDPEPERYDENGSEDAYFAWRDRQVMKALRAEFAPALSGNLQSQAVSVVKSRLARLGVVVTPEQEALLAKDAALTPYNGLQAVVNDPMITTNVAADYVEKFRTQSASTAPAKVAEKAAPAQVVARGIPASGTGGGAPESKGSVSIPKEAQAAYRQFINQFGEKDTVKTRTEWLASAGIS